MHPNRTTPNDIDAYIARYPPRVRSLLEQVRRTIRKAAPGASETIKYQIPTFTLNGNLVHFAAYAKHIGFYPAPRGVEPFKSALSRYEGGKGTVKFPLDEPLPVSLITRMVKFRVRKNRERTGKGRKRAV